MIWLQPSKDSLALKRYQKKPLPERATVSCCSAHSTQRRGMGADGVENNASRIATLIAIYKSINDMNSDLHDRLFLMFRADAADSLRLLRLS